MLVSSYLIEFIHCMVAKYLHKIMLAVCFPTLPYLRVCFCLSRQEPSDYAHSQTLIVPGEEHVYSVICHLQVFSREMTDVSHLDKYLRIRHFSGTFSVRFYKLCMMINSMMCTTDCILRLQQHGNVKQKDSYSLGPCLIQ